MAPPPRDETFVTARDAGYAPAAAAGQRRHAAPERELVYHRRHEQQCDNHRHCEVNDYHQRKICKVCLLVLGQEPHYAQSAYGREQSAEYRGKHPPVVVIAVVVDHYYRRVDHDAERDGDSSQRIYVYADIQQVVEYHGDKQVYRQRYGYHHEIPHIAAHQKDEDEQYGQTPQRTRIYLVQLVAYVPRCIV